MGFVQIAMDFGCTPAEEKASPAQAEKSASSNGNGHAQQEETRAEASKAPAHRRLAPPPPDKILVEEPEPVAEISLPEEEHVSIEEPFFPEEETRAADVPAEQMEQPAPSLAEITLEMAEKEENALVENRIPEEDEETDSDDDSPIEFELEPELQHEEDSIEGQVSIAYFQKADASEEDGEVFEIPMFSQPSTGPDSKPVVIVRVKEKKETGAGTGKNKRGRKSIRDMMAEAEMVEIPEDEILFKKQYYGIGEVAKMFGVNTSLIRFWETEFDIIKPKKNRKGDRLFRPIDVKNLHLIHNLLRLKKFTIEGAKDFLKNNRKKAEKNFEIEQSLKRIKGFLLQMKADVSLP